MQGSPLRNGSAWRRVLFLATAVACTTLFCALQLGVGQGWGGAGGGAAVLEQRRDFWSDDDSIWVPAHSKGLHKVVGGKMLAEGKAEEEPSVLEPDAVYEEAFHQAFHKAYAETFGKSLGEAEGELAGQAARGEAARSQIEAMNRQEHTVPGVSAPHFEGGEGEEGEREGEEEEEPREGEKSNELDAEEEEAQAEEEADEVPLGKPQDIRHYIKPWGDWMKGAVPKQEEPLPVQHEEEAEEEDKQEEESMPHEEEEGEPKEEAEVDEAKPAVEDEPKEGGQGDAEGATSTAGLSKALKAWGAVPLGAKSTMKRGPEYTNGEEHFGNHVHCPMGGCDPLEKAGVNVDSWRGFQGQVDVPRTVPWPAWDPSQDRKAARSMNQRVGRWAKYNKGNNPGRWGQAAEPLDDPTAHRLEKHGVNVMGSKVAKGLLYSALPMPALDDSELDKDTMRSRLPAFRDAAEALREERESDEKLETAGVRVNGLPADLSGADGKIKTYNHADGIADRLVSAKVPVPKYQKAGVAESQQPSSFLLRDDGLTAIHKQPTVNEEGLEVEAKEEAEEGDKETVVDEESKEQPNKEVEPKDQKEEDEEEPKDQKEEGEEVAAPEGAAVEDEAQGGGAEPKADEGQGGAAMEGGDEADEGGEGAAVSEAEAAPKEEETKPKSNKGGWDGGALGSVFG